MLEPLNLKKLKHAAARMLLAKDVLRLLDAGFIHPLKNQYLEFDNVYPKRSHALRPAMLRRRAEGGSFGVCAKGALFVAAVLRKDDGVTMGWWMDHDMEDYLAPFFAKADLDAIESAFSLWDNDGETKVVLPADTTARLRFLMQGLIANNGDLVVEHRIA